MTEPLSFPGSQIPVCPEALVFHPANGLFFEDKSFEADEFAVTLRPGMVLIFRRMLSTPECFEAREVRETSSQDPRPPVSVRGVLWSRRAARQADQDIAAYRRGVGLPPESACQSNLSGCRHEV